MKKVFLNTYGDSLTFKSQELAWIKSKECYNKEDLKKAFIEGHNVCRCVTDNTDEAEEIFDKWFNTIEK